MTRKYFDILISLFFLHFHFSSTKATLPPFSRTFEVANTSKAGLAWPNGNTVNISQYEGGKISWYVILNVDLLNHTVIVYYC